MSADIDTAPVMRDVAHPVLRPKVRFIKRTIAVFAFCIVALIASAIWISAEFHAVDGVNLLVMVGLGAVIIGLLLTSTLLPFLKEMREEAD